MNGGIYKITSPSGKIYIGQTNNFKRRKSWYKGLYTHEQPKIHNSLLKYGFDSHIWEEIESCASFLLNEREVFWKKHYLNKVDNDWGLVLYCNLYDNGGGPLSTSTKIKISEANRGKKRSLQAKENMSKGMLGREITWVDKIITPERNQKISDANKGKILGDKGKNPKRLKKMSTPITQYSLEGVKLEHFPSINEASRYLSSDNSKVTGISNNLRNRSKSAYGFIWKYV